MKINTYKTLSEAINQLCKRGFKNSFKFEKGLLTCIENKEKYRPDDLEIVEYHRFKGNSDPADMSIVFAISCQDGNQGRVVSSCGTYAINGLLSFIDKVKIADRKNVEGYKRKHLYY